MLVRVLCTRCRLAPAWTDDADGLLGTVCNRPFHCEGRLFDERGLELTSAHMASRTHALFRASDGAPPASASTGCVREPAEVPVARLVTIALSSIVAWAVCAALLAGYASAVVIPTLVVLGLPAFAALFVVRPLGLAWAAAAAALALASLGVDLIGAGSIAASPLRGLLVDVVAAALPLASVLPRPDRVAAWSAFLEGGGHGWHTAGLSFAAAAILFLGVGVPHARRVASIEDAGLIRRLVQRTKAEGNELVIGDLSAKLAALARRRVAVVADGELYDLADAELAPEARRDRVTLVVPLRTPVAPSRIEFDGLRGPTTTYRQTLELAAP